VKVFVAGASGAIGRVLIPQLVGAGHEVVGTTRREGRAAALLEAGAEPVVCDVFEADAVRAAVAAAAPEVVIDQLTSLPHDYNIRDPTFYAANDRVRREGTANVIAATRAAGVRRYIVQSVSFLTRPGGPPVLDEDAPPWTDAPAPFTDSVAVLVANEQAVTGSEDFEGLALRYGQFYGPGTYFASDGSIAAEVRRRRFPVVGAGTGRSSFVHVADAAAATVCAVSGGAPGVYNVTDDDPAELREWLPAYAAAIGAKKPFRVPKWLARVVGGPLAAALASELRGASNARAKAALGWAPVVASWRDGFGSYLDSDPKLPH
jgi:nucleoside-diphosphate-sugar epimerase